MRPPRDPFVGVEGLPQEQRHRPAVQNDVVHSPHYLPETVLKAHQHEAHQRRGTHVAPALLIPPQKFLQAL